MSELARVALTGEAVQHMAGAPGTSLAHGVLGVDVRGRVVEGTPHVVVQLLLDDDVADVDSSLLDAPLIAEVLATDTDEGATDTGSGTDAVIARELFDHDAFRRRLHEDRRRGTSQLRGVLVLTDGQLPPPWIRMAFLPIDLAATAGAELVLGRRSTEQLLDDVHAAHAAGRISETERTAAIVTLEQRHPGVPPGPGSGSPQAP